MATLPYEALIRFDDDGIFKGGHTIRRDPSTGKLSDAMPVGKDTDFPWADISAEINVAALARATALEAPLAAVKAKIDDTALDDVATVEAIKAIYVENERPDLEKRLAELDAEIAAKQAERDKLSGVGAVEADTGGLKP